MNKLSFWVLLLFLIIPFQMRAALSTGDIAVVGLNTDSNDDFSIVVLANIPANSTDTIFFSDKQWSGTAFGSSEGFLKWLPGATAIPAGTIIVFNNVSTSTPSVSQGTIIGNSGLSSSGENLFCYYGSNASTPTKFISAFATNATALGSLSNTGLTLGVNAIVISPADQDIVAYKGSREGTKSEIWANLNNMSNWDRQDGTGDQQADGTIPDLPFSTTAFNVKFYTLQILHSSDMEAGISAPNVAPYFAAIVDKLANDCSNTLIVSSGDNMIPGPFFNASSDTAGINSTMRSVYKDLYNDASNTSNLVSDLGRIDISIMNIIGYNAAAFGNHDFDSNTSILKTIINPDYSGTPKTLKWTGCQFPFLAANLDFSADSNLKGIYTTSISNATDYNIAPSSFATASNIKKIAPATIIERGGEKIGIVGATTQLLRSISSPGDVQVKGTDADNMDTLALYIQPTIDSLLKKGINKIVLLSHLQQISLEKSLITKLRGVDVVVAGGSHTVMLKDSDPLFPGTSKADTYPYITTNKDGDTAVVVNTDGEYHYVGRLMVDFDSNGKLYASRISQLSGGYASTISTVKTLWGDSTLAFASKTKGELVLRLTKAVANVIKDKDSKIIGKTTVFLEGRRTKVRTEETNLGNLSADANLYYAKQYDNSVQVSIKNGGGIRAEIGQVTEPTVGNFIYKAPQANASVGKQEGDISQLDIENSLRFNNKLSLVTVTATGLKKIVEHGVSAWTTTATPGQFPQVGGMAFSFNPDKTAGNRVNSLILKDLSGNNTDTIVFGGTIVGDSLRSIRVVTLDYMASGGDNYPFVSLATNRVNLETALTSDGTVNFSAKGSEQDAFAEYLKANFSTIPYSTAETTIDKDSRIQNLKYRTDDLLKYDVSITSPSNGTVVTPGTTVKVSILDKSVSYQKVSLYVNGAYFGSDNTAPYEFSLPSTSIGFYRIYAVATDINNVSKKSPVVVVKTQSASILTQVKARIAILSDVHYFDPSLLIQDGTAFQSYLAQDRKLVKESHSIAKSAISMLRQENPDIVLISGDLTKDGEKSSHQKIAKMLDSLEMNGTTKVFVIPGNHDVSNPDAVSYDGSSTTNVENVNSTTFKEIYSNFGYKEAIAKDTASLSYVAEPISGMWLIAMDACRYYLNTAGSEPHVEGEFKPATYKWVMNQLDSAKKYNKTVIGMIHHGITEHYTGQTETFPEYVINGWDTIRTRFADAGMKVVFTGHYHANDATLYTSPKKNTIYDVETGSLVTAPCPFRVAYLYNNNTLEIQTRYVKSIDIMPDTFAIYANNYLRNGMLSLVKYQLIGAYQLDAATASVVSPYLTDAFIAHYTGDEKITPAASAFIAKLSQGNSLMQLLASQLNSLYTDLPPADNSLQINLANGNYENPINLAFYKNYVSDSIGTFNKIKVRETGGSGLFYIPGSDMEFWTLGDRGPNLDAKNLLTASDIQYSDAKVFAFPDYSPKLFRVALKNDSIKIMQTINLKRPDGKAVSGRPNPIGLGNAMEKALSDNTDFAKANPLACDTLGIDCEGIALGKDNDLFICEEYAPSVWRVDATTGKLKTRYTPFSINGYNNVQVDTVLKYRRPNRGFEGVTTTPNGKVYAIMQSPMYNPANYDKSRIIRLLEINTQTGQNNVYAVLLPVISGVKTKDWKMGDLVAVNNNELLTLAHATGSNGIDRIVILNLNLQGATAITSEKFTVNNVSKTFEQLVEGSDTTGLTKAVNGVANIVPVQSKNLLNLYSEEYAPYPSLMNIWDNKLEKPEGLAIMNDSTLIVTNDNDFGIVSPNADGVAVANNITWTAVVFNLKGDKKLTNFVSPKLYQTVSFDSISTKIYGDSTFLVRAKASSGLSVSYDISNHLIAKVVKDSLSIQGAGQTEVVASQEGNTIYYPASTKRTLIVNKKDLLVRADNKSKIYGDNNPELTMTFDGLTYDDTISDLTKLPQISTLANKSSNVGEYDIALSDGSDANYTYHLTNGKLTITKKALTVSVKDTSKIVGEENPEFVLVFEGFVEGDDKSDLDVSPTAQTVATKLSPVGTYDINVNSGTDNNYEIVGKKGTLTVTKATDINISKEISISVYPNPVCTYLKINQGQNKAKEVKIFDNAGKLVLVKTSNFETINMEMLSSGVYHLYIICDDGTAEFKIIKR